MLAFAQPDLFSKTHDIEHEDVLGEALWHKVMRPHDPPLAARFKAELERCVTSGDVTRAMELVLVHTSWELPFEEWFPTLERMCETHAQDSSSLLTYSEATRVMSAPPYRALREELEVCRKKTKRDQAVVEVAIRRDRLACRDEVAMLLDVSFPHHMSRGEGSLRRALPRGSRLSRRREVRCVTLPGGRTLGEMRWTVAEDYRPALMCACCGHVPERRDRHIGQGCQRGRGCQGHYVSCGTRPGHWMVFIHRLKNQAALVRRTHAGVACWMQGEEVALLPHDTDFFESKNWLPCGPARHLTPDEEWARHTESA